MFVNARAIIERRNELGIVEVLIQMRDKPDQPKGLEFPGGRIEEFESIVEALYREVFEETGLKVKKISDELNRNVYSSNNVSVEGLTPFFVYQTIKGPVDSIGFIFRCEVEEGKLCINEEAYGHRWISIKDLDELFRNNPLAFDSLTQGLLDYYLKWVIVNLVEESASNGRE
jgi:8-oxo-dGTP diphosphatase